MSLNSASAVQTRDSWRSVRTNNLFVIGNADPEKLRQVAAWLEFFHSAFARLVSRNVLDKSVPTTVVLFRDEASFTPFKPLYQGRPANIAGFFQPGEDVNYIAISLDPGERDPFSTAFHEYVHLHLKDNVPSAPLWLNEGLAEFYGTMQFSGGEALLGAPLAQYIRLLREQEMLPLSTLFSIGTNSPHYNEQAKSGIFYGQSWALVHYLMLGGSGGSNRQDQFKRFLQQVSRGDAPAKALEDSFGMSVETIENELRAYLRRSEFPALRIASADPEAYASYTAMQRASLTDAEANYYLGDLLFHINRQADAERYFKQAIALDPNLRQAHAALGLLYVYQRRYADAKRYLQRATESQQSYLIHYLYAFVLSREGVSANGLISSYSKESAVIMRENLLKSIKLSPQYAPAYYLLALVDFVSNERLDEALEMVQRARQLEPAKTSYALLLARIYLRRSQNAQARELLESLARSSDAEVRSDAKEILDSLNGQPNRNTATAPRVSSAMITEPEPTGSSTRIVGGGSSDSVEIRDGHKITSSGSLPTVDEVLQRHVEAMGGEAAINRVTSRVITGTVDVAGISRGGSFETHALAPNKMLTVIQAHPVGTIKIGFNGKNGWYLASGALRSLKGAELATLQREADFYSPLRIKKNFAKVTLPGMSKIGYRDVYVVDLEPLSGAAERLYLDAQTYLPVRINTVRTVGRVSEPVEIYLDDWRDYEGIKYPFSTSQNSPSVKLGYTVKEIRHNVVVDPRLFEPGPR